MRAPSRSTRASPPTPPGVVPTGAKVGIDATIREGIPRERYERIAYAYADTREDRRLRQGQGRRAPASAGDERGGRGAGRQDSAT